MKTLFAILFVFGLTQFSLANAAVLGLLPEKLEQVVVEVPVFGTIHGSYGLIGALCFGSVVMLRLRRSAR